jgi:glycosyltransferase involved in cell wall biosynthesis
MLAAAATVVALSAEVIAISAAVAEALRWRHPKIKVIPDGIEVVEFLGGRDGLSIRREEGIPAQVPLVGFVGRLDPWKGAHVFVRAAAEVARQRPSVRFMVCGGPLDGHLRYAADLRAQANSLGLDGRMIFADWRYPPNRIPEVMAALDVLVHASVEPEPFGMVLLEAMAGAKPVIAASAGGPIEIVRDGVTGILYPPGDHTELARAILSVVDNPALAQSMGRAGHERARDVFPLAGHARMVEDAYRSALSERGLTA